jgi:hypothetical protein
MTTEATRGHQAALPVHPSPELAPRIAITVGDAADDTPERTPEHEWPGSLFIFFANIAAIGMGVGAVACAFGIVYTLAYRKPEEAVFVALALVGLMAGCMVQRALARHLQHFSRWGWWGAMAELAVSAAGNAQVLFTTHSRGFIGLVISLLMMRYFWRRRADFGIDIGL